MITNLKETKLGELCSPTKLTLRPALSCAHVLRYVHGRVTPSSQFPGFTLLELDRGRGGKAHHTCLAPSPHSLPPPSPEILGPCRHGCPLTQRDIRNPSSASSAPSCNAPRPTPVPDVILPGPHLPHDADTCLRVSTW